MNMDSSNSPLLDGGRARRRLVWVIPALLALTGILGTGQTTNDTATVPVPATTDYSAFRIINDRNIFDPNRIPHTRGRHENRHAATVDFFSLTGTMIYQKGRFAFFDGSDSDNRKILEPGGTVAGYKVLAIQSGAVTLEAKGKPMLVKVGTQFHHEEDGTWQPVVNDEQLPETPVEESTDESSSSTEAPAADNSALQGNDILKKLMQQREQEMK